MASKKSDATTKAKPPVSASAGDATGANVSTSSKNTSRLLIAAFVGGVIVLETLIFLFLVPSGEEVAALAEHRLIEKTVGASGSGKSESNHSKGHSESGGAHGSAHGDAHGNTHGVAVSKKDENRIIEHDLGTFNIAFTPAGSDLPYRVEFRLFGELIAKDQSHLEEILAERQGRFRNRLLLEIRNASLEELQENQLGLIRRRILATSTELLGEPILTNVGFQDYQVIED